MDPTRVAVPQAVIQSRWTTETTRELFQQGQLADTLGIRLTAVRPDGMDAEVTVGDAHLRPDGIAHGGLALVLVETLGSVSACCAVDFERFNVFGMTVNVSHFKPAAKGQKLTARSIAVHVGRTTQVWDVVIQNEDSILISSGRITLIVLPRARATVASGQSSPA